MIKMKKIVQTVLLMTSLLMPMTMLQADATTGDITVAYYWVNLAANGNPDDDYELTLPRYNSNSRSSLIEGVNGTDDRYVDTNSSVVRVSTIFSALPYSSETWVFKSSTGFIVGPHVIATSAHCMDSYPEGIERLENCKVYVTDPQTNREIEFTVKQVHIPSLYMSTGYTDYDYALLTVSEDLTEYGMFSLGCIRDEVLENRGITVTVSGYPEEVATNGNVVPANNVLYTGKGSLMEVQENKLFYTTDATEGDSGGPAYVTTISTTQGNSSVTVNTVIGINHGQDDIDRTNNNHTTDIKNAATRITEPVLQFYRNNPNIGY